MGYERDEAMRVQAATEDMIRMRDPLLNRLRVQQDARLRKERDAARAMLAALKEISLGRGPYKIDQMAHAESTIEAMKDIAKEAIAQAEAAGIKAQS